MLIPQEFNALCSELIKQEENHNFEFIWFSKYNQMSLWVNCRPVYIFKEIEDMNISKELDNGNNR